MWLPCIRCSPQSGSSYICRAHLSSWRIQCRWIEQEDHVRVADEAARVYVKAREAGEDDIGRLLMKIGGEPQATNQRTNQLIRTMTTGKRRRTLLESLW
eukprot:scaffold10667_cov132-Isochrysis_galbana.AAC.2